MKKLCHWFCCSDSRCKDSCDILNLGMYVKTENYFSLSKNQVSLLILVLIFCNVLPLMYRWHPYDTVFYFASNICSRSAK